MNRTIKFRGFHASPDGPTTICVGGKEVRGRWVEGYYSPLILPIVGSMGHYINEGGYRAVEVLEDTVGQFTGLREKGGREIYEFDMVEWGDTVAPIKYEAPTFYYADNEDVWECSALNPLHAKYHKVIGTTFDKEG